jgi:hypothetical protein
MLAAPAALAEMSFYVPVVTQVQGAAFYRTSLAAASTGSSATIFLIFRYRSPVDGSFQAATFITPNLARYAVFALDDVVDYLKTKNAIRAEDQQAALFGTLEVQFFETAITDPRRFSVVARTYSPGAGNAGTVGIAYAGRYVTQNSSFIGLVTTLRNGPFGRDGSSRANIGFMSMANTPIDIRLQYVDSANPTVILKDVMLSAITGRLLDRLEVVQLNNVFADASLSSAAQLTLIATPTGGAINGYVVQLDNTTNDGSFFLMTEQ